MQGAPAGLGVALGVGVGVEHMLFLQLAVAPQHVPDVPAPQKLPVATQLFVVPKETQVVQLLAASEQVKGLKVEHREKVQV